MLTAVFAAGVLFIKYQLEGLRQTVQSRVEERVGARLAAGAVMVNGLRGLRIDAFHLTTDGAGEPVLSVSVPAAYLYIDLVDLLYGQLTVDRIQIDDAVISLTRAEGQVWLPAEGIGASPASDLAELTGSVGFRVAGANCTFEARNVVGDTSVLLTDLRFDVSRPPDASDMTARISGLWGGHAEKRVHLNARYTSQEDFDLRLHSEGLSADDVNVFLPAQRQFVTAGTARPSLRVSGYPGRTLVVALEADFGGLLLRDQPELFEAATGTLTALANYDVAAHLLTLTTAKAESDQLAGRLEGTVDFSSELPAFDLRLEAERLPTMDLLDYVLPEDKSEYGELKVTLSDPYGLSLSIKGDSESPVFSAEASVNGGAVAFVPADKEWPEAKLEFGLMKLAWNPDQKLPQGTVSISGGTLFHASTGLRAEKVSGTLLLQNDRLVLDPLNAEVTGRPLVGRMEYDAKEEKAVFSANGVIAGVENTKLASAITDVRLAGAVGFRADGTIRGGQYLIDGAVDLTQAQFDFEWWFRKPAGMGAVLQAIHVDARPGKALKFSGAGGLDASKFTATVDVLWTGNAWQGAHARAKIDLLDVPSVAKCLRIPYAATGGSGSEGVFEWERAPGPQAGAVIKIAGLFDDVAFRPRGGTAPLHCRNARVEVILDDSDRANRTGSVVLHAEAASMPALGEVWFLPLKPDNPEELALYPPESRAWDMRLTADAMQMPPWKGTNFAAKVRDLPTETIVESFSADIDGGRLEGRYSVENTDTTAAFAATWRDVPSTYFLRHLEIAEMLNGLISGDVQYTVDEDDPRSTLAGTGQFEIRDGQFSADYLVRQFERQLEGDISSLPRSLKFSKLSSKVVLERDKVTTPDLLLESSDIRIAGSGFFITEGDMDYVLTMGISPETAQRIPILRDSFNVEGHRLTQQRIDLAFRINGPTFGPRSRVEGLPPVGVTLVSGAMELGSEAIKVIDAPRQILLDLFKIVGGAMGPTRPAPAG